MPFSFIVRHFEIGKICALNWPLVIPWLNSWRKLFFVGVKRAIISDTDCSAVFKWIYLRKIRRSRNGEEKTISERCVLNLPIIVWEE